MARDQLHLEHLLRRAGFGASAGGAGGARGHVDVRGARLPAELRASSPTTWTSKIGQADYVSVTRARRRSRRTRTSRTRGSAGCSGWCTRSVRCRRRWRSSGTTTSPPPTARSPAPSAPSQGTKMMALKARRAARARRGRSRLFRETALGSFRDLLVEVAQDPAMLVWLDGRTEHAAAAAGELRPRDHGAVHVRCRQLHRAGRLRRGARVHRLEPARSWATATTTTGYYEFVVQRQPARSDGEDVHVPDLSRTARTTIPARAAARRHAGRHRLHHRAGHASRRRRERLARKLWNFFVSEVVPPDADFVNGAAERLPAERHEHRAARALHAAVALVPEPGQLAHALLVAGRVRRARGQGSRAGRLLGRHARARRSTAMGQTLFEPPDVNGWELGQGLVLDRRDAGAHELRRRRSPPTSGSTWRATPPAPRTSPETLVEFFLERLSPAPFDAEPLRRAAWRTCRTAARGPDPTRSCRRRRRLARLIVGSAEYQLV